MKKRISSLLLICLVFSCVTSCNDSKKSVKFNKENFKEHYIDAIKGTLLLPPKYELITKENLPYLISKMDSISFLNRLIHNLEADRRDYVLYTDSNNLNDIILIHKSEFVSFSKRDANQYLGLLEANMKHIYGAVNFERQQEKISQTERSKYIKIKYKILDHGLVLYQTQYIVTSAAVTFGVIEMRKDVTDNEDLIKRINYLVN